MYDDLIPNEALRADAIPAPHASEEKVLAFALTFDGYAWAGSTERCQALANSAREAYSRGRCLTGDRPLSHLRCCLYAEQRRSYHTGSLSPDDLAYLRDLVECIRQQLESTAPDAEPRPGRF